MELRALSTPEEAAIAGAALTLEDIRRRLRQHALWKIEKSERAAALMIKGYSHQEIRAALGVSSEQYRGIRRWLRDAMDPEVRYEVPARPIPGRSAPPAH